MSIARSTHTATLLTDGTVLIAGGYNGQRELSSAEIFNPNTEKWTATGSLMNRRQNHTATLLHDGKVLVVGGYGSSQGTFLPIAYAELYDPTRKTWTVTGSMNYPRSNHTATLLPNGKVLVVGGEDIHLLASSSAELYDPTTETWTETGKLNTSRAYHTATLLPNGKVLIMGGYDNNFKFLSNAELFDPSNETFTVINSMKTARAYHTATLLTNGKVLVAGGMKERDSMGILSSVELFDPSTEKWVPFGSLKISRFDHAAALMQNGNILFTGGQTLSLTFGNFTVSKAELYVPPIEK
jgi:N-acetylneuraminic acid mutarotase